MGPQFRTTPEIVGYYRLGDFLMLGLTRRPSWIARRMVWWLLDWRWEDAK